MKNVNAYAKSHTIPEVAEALHRVDGLSGVAVLHAHGFGRSRIPTEGECADELGVLEPLEEIEVFAAMCSSRRSWT